MQYESMHELIDREDPKCLYCNSKCDLRVDGDVVMGPGSAAINLSFEVQILKCQKCHEIFEIHWVDFFDKITFTTFVFTCKTITVYNKYNSGFIIGGKELLCSDEYALKYPETEFIPMFPVNFSNKKKLYKKLKTYLVFS